MITSNSGESRSKNMKNTEGKRETKSYRDNRNSEGRDSKPYKKDLGDGSREQKERYRKNSGNNVKGNRDFKDGRDNRNGGNGQRRDSYKNGEVSGANKTYKRKAADRNFGDPYDKDDEDNVRPQKRQQVSKDNKVKEQQPDKIEIINRIEKEKKAMKKKQADRKNAKPARMQSRPKRSNNIDWTREYENGSYDDDDLDMYL